MDDERNTDNAWLETSVRHFHDDNNVLQKFFLNVSGINQSFEYFNVRNFCSLKISRVRPFAKFRAFRGDLISRIDSFNLF